MKPSEPWLLHLSGGVFSGEAWRLEHGEEGPTESTKIFVNLMSSLRLSFGRRDVEPTKKPSYYVSLDWLVHRDPY